jgi:hypothetical protein
MDGTLNGTMTEHGRNNDGTMTERQDKKKDNKDKKERIYITPDFISDLEIDPKLDTQEVRDALKAWIEHKTNELKAPYKTIGPIKAILTQALKGKLTPSEFEHCVLESINRKWAGVGMYATVLDDYRKKQGAKDPSQDWKKEFFTPRNAK